MLHPLPDLHICTTSIHKPRAAQQRPITEELPDTLSHQVQSERRMKPLLSAIKRFARLLHLFTWMLSVRMDGIRVNRVLESREAI